MQIVAEMWLVLTLTGQRARRRHDRRRCSSCRCLLVGAWGGLLADRCSKRRLLLVTQALMAIPALALFALTAAGVVEAWMV